MDELNYRPNLLARSMRTRRTGRIAVLLPAATELLPLTLLSAVSAAAHQAGYAVDLVALEGSTAERAQRAEELATSGEFEGILALASLGEFGRPIPPRPPSSSSPTTTTSSADWARSPTAPPAVRS